MNSSALECREHGLEITTVGITKLRPEFMAKFNVLEHHSERH